MESTRKRERQKLRKSLDVEISKSLKHNRVLVMISNTQDCSAFTGPKGQPSVLSRDDVPEVLRPPYM